MVTFLWHETKEHFALKLTYFDNGQLQISKRAITK